MRDISGSDGSGIQGVLQELGYRIDILNRVKGGVVSNVYQGVTERGEKVIIKRTLNFHPTYPTPLLIDRGIAQIDLHVLKLLEDHSPRTPRVHAYIPEITTIVMEDLTSDGFFNMEDLITQGNLLPHAAVNIGEGLSALLSESESWETFSTVETADSSFDQRGLELRIAYPSEQEVYCALEHIHAKGHYGWVWADSHPKNMLLNARGEVAFVDFGESYWGDQRYVFANFIAHIVVYSLSGYISQSDAAQFISVFMRSVNYSNLEDQRILCKYVAMEILHRANGRWLGTVHGMREKLLAYGFGLHCYEEIENIESMCSSILHAPQIIAQKIGEC